MSNGFEGTRKRAAMPPAFCGSNVNQNLLTRVDVLYAVALVLERTAVSANLRHPAVIFALVFVRGHIAADAIARSG